MYNVIDISCLFLGERSHDQRNEILLELKRTVEYSRICGVLKLVGNLITRVV